MICALPEGDKILHHGITNTLVYRVEWHGSAVDGIPLQQTGNTVSSPMEPDLLQTGSQ